MIAFNNKKIPTEFNKRFIIINMIFTENKETLYGVIFVIQDKESFKGSKFPAHGPHYKTVFRKNHTLTT